VNRKRLRRSRAYVGFSALTAGVFILQLGSNGDRLGIFFVWLLLTLPPEERYVDQVERFLKRSVMARYVLISAIAIIWMWATCRLRGGGGPFHIRDLGVWRGYPFAFENRIFILNPSPSSVREIYWAGLAGDLLILTLILLATFRWLWRVGAEIESLRALLLAGFASVFVWLNVDVWIGVLPLTWIGSQLNFRPNSEIHRGFPFAYEHLFPVSEWRWVLLAIDVAIGILAWASLYGSRYAAQRLAIRTLRNGE
jgi:hypothetical protein